MVPQPAVGPLALQVLSTMEQLGKEITDSKNVTKLISVFCEDCISNACGQGLSGLK